MSNVTTIGTSNKAEFRRLKPYQRVWARCAEVPAFVTNPHRSSAAQTYRQIQSLLDHGYSEDHIVVTFGRFVLAVDDPYVVLWDRYVAVRGWRP